MVDALRARTVAGEIDVPVSPPELAHTLFRVSIGTKSGECQRQGGNGAAPDRLSGTLRKHKGLGPIPWPVKQPLPESPS